MPKQIVLFKYTPKGYQGLLKESASERLKALSQVFTSLGGKLDTIYWSTSGDYTGVIIGEASAAAITALLAAVDATGIVANIRVISALTTEEADVALKDAAPYRPPGA